MARVDAEIATNRTAEISIMLSAWHYNRDSDSVRIQNFRASEFALASRLLHDIVYDVKPEQRLRLEVGSKPAQGSYFLKDAYDFSYEHHETLEPGQELIFERAEYRGNAQGREELYAGRPSLLIAVSALARTLHERGRLTVVAHEEATV